MSCDFVSLGVPGVRGLQPYQPGKPVEELERELGLRDVVKLASNENPLGPSEAVAASVERTIRELPRYPDGSAYHLKNVLAEHHGVEENRLTIGNGSNDVLELLARAFLTAADRAVVSQHAFIVYPLVVRAIGAELATVPARQFGHDLEAMAAAVDERTRIVFIANPNNPTGTWVSDADLRGFLAQVPENVLVVLDEAYCEYVDEAAYPDGLSLMREFPNLIVTRTFSKVYGLASLRLGYAVSDPDIADLMNRIRQPFNVNSFALAAGVAAIGDQEYVGRSVALNHEGMREVKAGLEKLGMDYIPSIGNFVTVDMGRDATESYQQLLQQGVIVRPIGVYDMPNHLRVTIGLPAENQRFLESLRLVLSQRDD